MQLPLFTPMRVQLFTPMRVPLRDHGLCEVHERSLRKLGPKRN